MNIAVMVVPTFAVLLGILLNNQAITSLRAEFNQLRGEMTSLRGEMTSLRGEMTSLRVDVMTAIQEVKQDAHKDALEIMRQMTSLHERVAVVETRTSAK